MATLIAETRTASGERRVFTVGDSTPDAPTAALLASMQEPKPANRLGLLHKGPAPITHVKLTKILPPDEALQTLDPKLAKGIPEVQKQLDALTAEHERLTPGFFHTQKVQASDRFHANPTPENLEAMRKAEASYAESMSLRFATTRGHVTAAISQLFEQRVRPALDAIAKPLVAAVQREVGAQDASERSASRHYEIEFEASRLLKSQQLTVEILEQRIRSLGPGITVESFLKSFGLKVKPDGTGFALL